MPAIALTLLMALSQAPKHSITVRERLAPSVVEVRDPSRAVEVGAAPRAGGKLGWSFDTDRSCTTYVVVPQTPDSRSTSDRNTKLVSFSGFASGTTVVIAESKNGLSSPILSPDGSEVLIVRDADSLVRIAVASKKEVLLGAGDFGFWTVDGAVNAYSRRADGCHVVRRFPRVEGKPTETIQCGGYSIVPVASGVAPVGVPLPIIDKRGNVVGLLGTEAELQAQIVLSSVERGVACSAGVDFVASDGSSVTLAQTGGKWRLAPGESCQPVKDRKGFVKVETCLVGSSP